MLQVVSVLSIYTICLQIVFVSAIFLDSSCCCYEREQMTVVEASDWLTNQARVTQYKTNACSISLFIFLYLPIRDKLSWTRCREMHSNSRSQLHLWWILWWPINLTSMFVTGGGGWSGRKPCNKQTPGEIVSHFLSLGSMYTAWTDLLQSCIVVMEMFRM